MAYWDRVKKALIRGIKQARARLEPARLGIATGESRANTNRRGTNARGKRVLGEDPDGPVDHQIGRLRLARPDGSPISLVANYAIVSPFTPRAEADFTVGVSRYIQGLAHGRPAGAK